MLADRVEFSPSVTSMLRTKLLVPVLLSCRNGLLLPTATPFFFHAYEYGRMPPDA